MKISRLYTIALLMATLLFSCDPIEDDSLREKYYEKAGEPILQADLDAALSVTQPVAGSNQLVELKNSRADIAGVWHLQWSVGEKTVSSDHTTIEYDANGDYEIWFTGISANQIVTSKTFNITVSDLPVDEYVTFLTGAETASDLTAKKEWQLWSGEVNAVYNGMYAMWQYYEPKPGQNTWNGNGVGLTADDYNARLIFEFDSNKISVVAGNGTVLRSGNWAFSHSSIGKAMGELFSTIGVIGHQYRWQAWGGVNTPYWIIRISNDELILCLPGTYSEPAEFYNYDASYYFFKTVD